MLDEGLEYPWSEYALLQKQSRQIEKLNHHAWAVEDQLNFLLDSLATHSFSIEQEALEKRLNSLSANRRRKHRNRCKLLREWTVISIEASSPELVIQKLAQDEQLAQIQALTSIQEWRILQSLSQGQDYESIAQIEVMTVSAVKTKVSRCRQRLRERLAA